MLHLTFSIQDSQEVNYPNYRIVNFAPYDIL